MTNISGQSILQFELKKRWCLIQFDQMMYSFVFFKFIYCMEIYFITLNVLL